MNSFFSWNQVKKLNWDFWKISKQILEMFFQLLKSRRWSNLRANAPVEVKSLQAAIDIGLHVDLNKTYVLIKVTPSLL